jgi:hypothetical protein
MDPKKSITPHQIRAIKNINQFELKSRQSGKIIERNDNTSKKNTPIIMSKETLIDQ